MISNGIDTRSVLRNFHNPQLAELINQRSVGNRADYVFTGDKTAGINYGYWAREAQPSSEVMLKAFSGIIQRDDSSPVTHEDEKLLAIKEYIAGDIFNLLLPKVTPVIRLLDYTSERKAVASKKLPNFRTLIDINKGELVNKISSASGFEKGVATNLFLGNFDWLNFGNIGLIGNEFAFIDFGLAFTLHFDNVPMFLSHISRSIRTTYKVKTNDKKEYEINLSDHIHFSLDKFTASIKNIIQYDVELWMKIISSKIRFLNRIEKLDCNLKFTTTLNNIDRQFEQHCITKPMRSFEEFEETISAFIQAQHRFFKEVLRELKIIRRFNMPEKYFEGEWLAHYFRRPNEALCHAALRNIHIKGKEVNMSAVEWAIINKKKIFGTHPAHGVLSYCHLYGIHKEIRTGTTSIIPVNDRRADYAVRSTKEKTSYTTSNSLAFAKGNIDSLIDCASAADFNSSSAAAKLFEDMSKYGTDYYLFMFMAYCNALTTSLGEPIISNLESLRSALLERHYSSLDMVLIRQARGLQELFGNSDELIAEAKKDFDKNRTKHDDRKIYSTRMTQLIPFHFTYELYSTIVPNFAKVTFLQCESALGVIGKFLFENASILLFGMRFDIMFAIQEAAAINLQTIAVKDKIAENVAVINIF